ncbi:MAG: hypothetical protein DESF_01272 [Desulfovibrio sp.]
MSDKKHNKSLLFSRLWPGRRLSASWCMALGGSLWLVACLALALWLSRGEETPFTAADAPSPQVGGPVPALNAAAAEAAQSARMRMAALDSVAEEALSDALPQARWRREVLPAAGTAKGQTGGHKISQTGGHEISQTGHEISAKTPGIHVYTITGPCAPLRLGLALLDRLSPQEGGTLFHDGSASRPAVPASPTRAAPGETKKAGHDRAVPDTSFLRDGTLRPFWTGEGQLEIRDHGRLTHRFLFPGREGELTGLDMPLPRPALVLVIDDMGQSIEAAGALIALPYAVTPAIWPHAPQARATAELAAQRRMDVLVHVPMEALPRKGGTVPDPGQGVLKVGMTPQHLQSVLAEDLAALPAAVGMNNHMGSALTGDAAACRIVCAHIAGTGLFLLDSVTTPDSHLAQEGRAQRIVSAERAVFLDTNRQPAAILKALDQAAALARTRGYAIAIGHPYAETLSALRTWQNREGVALVPLRRLIWSLALENAGTTRGRAARTRAD